MQRALRDIAIEIERDWPVINNGAARNALALMKLMGSIQEPFRGDPNGYGVVGAFLENSHGWSGETAERVRKELRQMCSHPRP